ncbi:MAG: sugar transporter permease [Eubacterium sp.]|jgi:raffinose/stachyose/melibiose transport system permease protein|nr:sugar transporter permease [Eubacterium sp.]
MSRKLSLAAGRIMLFLVLIVISLLIIVPLMIMILGSFKDPLEVSSFNLALPQKWLFENYVKVFAEGKIGSAFYNSITITVISVALTIFVSSMASFVVARRNSKTSGFLYYFFFLGTLVPMQIIPTIKIFQAFHIYGTISSAMLIYCALNISFSCFLYTGFIKGIPRALDEAAFIEGASVLKIFYKIVFPLLKPINMTVMILIFMNIWNDINIPLYFLSNPSKWTMPLTVYNFFGQYSGSNWNLVFADLTITVLPVVALYLFAQRYIVAGLTSGAVKQ